MSLSAVEYREHLLHGGTLAGFGFKDVVLPQDKTASLNGLKFHYLDWGGDKTPLIFLHGAALTAHTWDLCSLALRNDFRCIALDQRGHGDSDWAPETDYSIASMRKDVAAFVDHLGIDKFVLVGMSMGAVNSLAYAIDHGEKLRALVMVDAGPGVPRMGSKRIQDFVTRKSEFPSVQAVIDQALEFNPRRDPNVLRRSLMHNLRQTPEGNWTWKYDRNRFVKMDRDALLKERNALWPGVAQLKCPALVVRGAESDVFLDEDAEKLSATFPDGRWVKVQRAGHTVQGDNPKDLVAELRKFFTKVGIL